MTIEKFEDIQNDFPGAYFQGPDGSIWKFVECQASVYANYQWNVYESKAHSGVLVWVGYCGYAYDEAYNDEVWEVYSSKWLYLPSLEDWHASLADGDFC